jgi:hypothetical protein
LAYRRSGRLRPRAETRFENIGFSKLIIYSLERSTGALSRRQSPNINIYVAHHAAHIAPSANNTQVIAWHDPLHEFVKKRYRERGVAMIWTPDHAFAGQATSERCDGLDSTALTVGNLARAVRPRS